MTIYPVVIFYRNGDELKHRTLMFISDDLDHDSDLVEEIQDKTMEIVKKDYPLTTNVEYLTYSCAAQYKNKKSFLYLCEHEKKHKVKAKYNYHPTSHGKSMCDAASACAKRKVAYASLQRLLDNEIINAQDVFNYLKSTDWNIDFVMIYKVDVDKRRKASMLRPELQPVPGTRSFHQYIPLNGKIGTQRFQLTKFVTSFEFFSSSVFDR